LRPLLWWLLFWRGEIAGLAKDLRKKLREADLKPVGEFKFAKEFRDFPVCYEVLGAMVKIRCKGCSAPNPTAGSMDPHARRVNSYHYRKPLRLHTGLGLALRYIS